MEAQLIPLQPYLNWSVEELQAAVQSKLERANQLTEQAQQMLSILALRGFGGNDAA